MKEGSRTSGSRGHKGGASHFSRPLGEALSLPGPSDQTRTAIGSFLGRYWLDAAYQRGQEMGYFAAMVCFGFN